MRSSFNGISALISKCSPGMQPVRGLQGHESAHCGRLRSYHAAGASARYSKDANADHLHAALNILFDAVALGLKAAELLLCVVVGIIDGSMYLVACLTASAAEAKTKKDDGNPGPAAKK